MCYNSNMPKKVLIVEDEPPLQRLLSNQLSSKGLEVICANDGKEGLDMALASHPDIILLDIILPVFDGLKFLHGLREDSWGKSAEVMVLTNLSDPKRVAEAKSLGVVEYLIKSGTKTSDVAAKLLARLGM